MIFHELQREQVSRRDFEAKTSQIDRRAEIKVLTPVGDRTLSRVLALAGQIKFRFSEEFAGDEAEVAAWQFKDGDHVVSEVVTDVEQAVVVLADVRNHFGAETENESGSKELSVSCQ